MSPGPRTLPALSGQAAAGHKLPAADGPRSVHRARSKPAHTGASIPDSQGAAGGGRAHRPQQLQHAGAVLRAHVPPGQGSHGAATPGWPAQAPGRYQSPSRWAQLPFYTRPCARICAHATGFHRAQLRHVPPSMGRGLWHSAAASLLGTCKRGTQRPPRHGEEDALTLHWAAAALLGRPHTGSCLPCHKPCMARVPACLNGMPSKTRGHDRPCCHPPLCMLT